MKTCPECGFDGSTDYETYPTLSSAPAGRPCRRHFAGQEELEALRQQWAADRIELESLRQQVAELKSQNEERLRESDRKQSWFARPSMDKSESTKPAAPAPQAVEKDELTNKHANTLILKNAEEFRATKGQRLTVEHLVVNGGTFVRQETFRDFLNLRTIQLADSIQAICENSFRNCQKLEKITFGKRLKRIWNGAFRGCAALKGLKFPEGMQHLSSYAFASCTSLTSVNFPESIRRVSRYAFANCSSLSEVTGISKCESVSGSAFENTPFDKTWKK